MKCNTEHMLELLEEGRVAKENININDGWVPVAAKLPKIDTKLWVTYDFRSVIGVDEAWHDGSMWFDTADGVFMGTVIAWMPLAEPVPYKPKGENNGRTAKLVE